MQTVSNLCVIVLTVCAIVLTTVVIRSEINQPEPFWHSTIQKSDLK